MGGGLLTLEGFAGERKVLIVGLFPTVIGGG